MKAPCLPCWLFFALAECLVKAAPIHPKTHLPSPSPLPTFTPTLATPITPIPSPFPTTLATQPSFRLARRGDRDEKPSPTLFAHLLAPSTFTSINPFPARPTIPLVHAPYQIKSVPATTDPPKEQNTTPGIDAIQPPTAVPTPSTTPKSLGSTPMVPAVTGSRGYDARDPAMTSAPKSSQGAGSDQDHSDSSDGHQKLFKDCLAARAPTLPVYAPPEVGVVRLFSEAMYRGKTLSFAGCGCVSLSEPFALQSFVGSRNHSFTFYAEEHCPEEPKALFQRFGQHFDTDGVLMVRSVRITQGVLMPIPEIRFEHLIVGHDQDK